MANKAEQDGLTTVTSQIYSHQAQFFLNAFWPEFSGEAEDCWKFCQGFNKLDNVKGKEGNELDEFWSHKFLETHGDTMTAIQMRNALKEIDIDCNKRMSFIEYALWKYKQTVKELLIRPQGDNRAEIEKAQKMLAAVQVAFDQSEKRAEEAKKALKEANTREAEAETAKVELEAALADVNAQQQEYDNTTADLKAKSEQGGQVAQNKAKAELAAHLNKPTLALTRAKITAEAAVKKAEKTRIAATEARAAAERAKVAADAALEDARSKVDEAEAFLQQVKAKSGGGQGSIWWMERELHEARAYLPERKGGYKKDK